MKGTKPAYAGYCQSPQGDFARLLGAVSTAGQ